MATGRFFREEKLVEQKSYRDGLLFPAVLSLTDNANIAIFEESIRSEKQWLEFVLHKSGVILFRGFPVTSPSDFNDVVEAFGFPELVYMGGRAPRTKVVGRIYTANESPVDKQIPFHHEMAYEWGGETPVVLSHIIYENMKEKHPETIAQMEKHGLTYKKVMSDEDRPLSFSGESWKSAYMTDDKSVVEERVWRGRMGAYIFSIPKDRETASAETLGSKKPIYVTKLKREQCWIDRATKQGRKLEWMGNAVKIITGPLPAFRLEKESQHITWFNTLVSSNAVPMKDEHDTHVELGNGYLAPHHVIKDCVKIMEEECVAIPWKKGDIMLVNNLMVLHGRRPLLKPPRRILASLCK